MTYRRSYENWFGEREYETVETPDSDYDAMKQRELDDKRDELQKAIEDAEFEHIQAGILVEIARDQLEEAIRNQNETRRQLMQLRGSPANPPASE